MIRISVKGTEEQARAAMDARGVTGEPAPACRQRPTAPVRKDSSFFDVPDDQMEKLAHWFCEQASCKPGEGYPTGTLLFYR